MGHPPAHCKPGVDTSDAAGRSTDRSPQGLSTWESQPTPSNDPGPTNEPQKPRRFLAQPVETSSRSSKAQDAAHGDRHNQQQAPEEETHLNNIDKTPPPRRFLPEPIETTRTTHRRAHSTSEVHDQGPPPRSRTSSGPRRFKPDLVETDTRSFRRGQAVRPSPYHAVGHSTTCANGNAGTGLGPDSHVTSESQFSYASLLRRQQARRHSFRVPELPSIASDSSEESGTSRSHSACTSVPGSSDKAIKDLVYEPVNHFAIDYDRDSEEDAPMKYNHVKSRRQSSADLSWELEYMRHHKEEAEMRLRAMVTSGQPKSSPEQKKRSPPLLGKDIIIPLSSSPDGTMCEHSGKSMPSHDEPELCNGCEGLWCGAPRHKGGKGAGLWMGTCSKEEGQARQVHGLFPGIVTPMARIDSAGVSKGLSPSPSHTHLDRLALSPGNSKLRKPTSPHLQKVIETEFNDGFVTQIYNYVSLGYPCLARYYDDELSRISGISVEDLRRDDLNTDARGYVVAPANNNLADACARWKALRLYIQEWALQAPGMADDETNLEGWGLPERKGSWAI
ncbi:unnamed protein product [Penicillium bialowiezense]